MADVYTSEVVATFAPIGGFGRNCYGGDGIEYFLL
jgi:hypothetical protein